jgi:biotin carboxyl carrier protein
MSATIESPTTEQPRAKRASGINRSHRATPPADAIRTDPPGESTASRTAAEAAAARKASARTAAAASAAARRARAMSAAEVAAKRISGTANGTRATAYASLESPVIADFVKMLPKPGGTWSQKQAVCWMEAIGATLRVIYGFDGPIMVTGKPAAA